MKTTVSCDQCTWSKEYNSVQKAKFGLAMHKGRKHGKIKSVAGARHWKKVPKRKYTKRKQEVQQPQGTALHFCPNCGLNLMVMSRAVEIATSIRM